MTAARDPLCNPIIPPPPRIDRIRFDVTKTERALIQALAARAKLLLPRPKRDMLDWIMDFTATHCNGCPMNFEKLLAADDFNFIHDASGICRHLNRENGKLEGNFLPRCHA